MRLWLLAAILVTAGLLDTATARSNAVARERQEAASRAAADCATITTPTSDDCIRLNQIQVLGTHNSYHMAPEPQLLAALGANRRDIEYSHRPLAEQLSRLGIRKFELDVFADPDGGRYASPAGLRMLPGLARVDEALREPGFKVIHTQDVDYRSTCPTLTRCLTIIRDWSLVNPGHVSIMVIDGATEFLGDRSHRRPLRGVFLRVIHHHPDCALTQLR